MTEDQIIAIQKRIGTVPDGDWGPKSLAACQRYVTNLMPKPLRFPVEAEVSGEASVYGRHGSDNYDPPRTDVLLPFPVFYEDKPVRTLRPHSHCAMSLLRVFKALAVIYPSDAKRRAAGILTYDGLYNPRLMRGSSRRWSMHAWAIAIDLDADRNGNLVHWPTAAVMPFDAICAFAREGWYSYAVFKSRDAMHFQATSPYA